MFVSELSVRPAFDSFTVVVCGGSYIFYKGGGVGVGRGGYY